MNRFRFTCLIGLALANASCLGFDKQTAFIVFPQKTDEVRVLLVYEGLQVMGDSKGVKEQDLESAKNQLRDLVNGRHFYVFGNFPSVQLKSAPDAKLSEQEKEVYAAFDRHLKLEGGEFFLNGDGKLSYHQQLTIREPRQFVKECNGWISRAFAKFAAEGLALDRAKLDKDDLQKWEKWDLETLKLLRAAGDGHHTWLMLEPGRLSFTMLGSEHFFTHLKREALKELKESAQLVTDTPWSLYHRKGHITVAVGLGGGEPIRLVNGATTRDQRKFDDELVAFAKGLPVKFDKTITTDGLIERMRR